MSIYIKIPPENNEIEFLPSNENVAKLKLSDDTILTLRTHQTAFQTQYTLLVNDPTRMLPVILYTTTLPINMENLINNKLKTLYEKEGITAEIFH